MTWISRVRKHPKRYYGPEAPVHRLAYIRLRDAFGEHRVVNEYVLPSRNVAIQAGRVDIAVLDETGKFPIALVEVKPYPKYRALQARPAQCDRYEMLSGVPVVAIRTKRMADVAHVIVRGMLKP